MTKMIEMMKELLDQLKRTSLFVVNMMVLSVGIQLMVFLNPEKEKILLVLPIFTMVLTWSLILQTIKKLKKNISDLTGEEPVD